MTIWTCLDVPRSDKAHVLALGADQGPAEGCRSTWYLWITATQFRSGKFKRWYDDTFQRSFPVYIDFEEREHAKSCGAFWCPERKAWLFATSRKDAELPQFIQSRREPPAVVSVEVPWALKDVAKSVGFRWNAEAKTWDIPRNRVKAALAAAPALTACRVVTVSIY